MKNVIANLIAVAMGLAIVAGIAIMTGTITWGYHGSIQQIDGQFVTVKEHYVSIIGFDEFVVNTEIIK